jgi:hypothetical protein
MWDWLLIVVSVLDILCSWIWGLRASQGFGISYFCRKIRGFCSALCAVKDLSRLGLWYEGGF